MGYLELNEQFFYYTGKNVQPKIVNNQESIDYATVSYYYIECSKKETSIDFVSQQGWTRYYPNTLNYDANLTPGLYTMIALYKTIDTYPRYTERLDFEVYKGTLYDNTHKIVPDDGYDYSIRLGINDKKLSDLNDRLVNFKIHTYDSKNNILGNVDPTLKNGTITFYYGNDDITLGKRQYCLCWKPNTSLDDYFSEFHQFVELDILPYEIDAQSVILTVSQSDYSQNKVYGTGTIEVPYNMEFYSLSLKFKDGSSTSMLKLETGGYSYASGKIKEPGDYPVYVELKNSLHRWKNVEEGKEDEDLVFDVNVVNTTFAISPYFTIVGRTLTIEDSIIRGKNVNYT